MSSATLLDTAAAPSAAAAARPAIVRIREVALERAEAPVAGFAIDLPRPDTTADLYGFTLQGWAMSTELPPVAIELCVGGRVIGRHGLNLRRKDIAKLYPGVEWAANSGFSVGVNVLRLPSAFELEVRLVLQDERRCRLAMLRGEWSAPAVHTQGFLQPILLTTLGRTGSTWATRVLGSHPEILAYRPFEYEPRLASYWLEILAALSDAASYTQALRGDLGGGDWWLGRRDGGAPASAARVEPEMDRWLGRSQPEALVPFCLERIEAFYRRAMAEEPERAPSFFAEKYSPASSSLDLLWALYPGTREVVLVRDFRDMICSIFAYNRKRGFEGFGRDPAQTDASYIARMREDASRLLERWTERSDTAFLLRYEDLVLEPERTLGELFEHLGVDARADTVQRVLAGARGATPEAQKQHATSSDPAASIGRWRNDLDGPLQAAARDAFGDILTTFGYEV